MEKEDSLPIVSVVGRPNVGKSSLFNRIIGQRLAVVHNEPGVTRDRLYHPMEWNGVKFRLVDTGGLVPSSKQRMEQRIKEQVEIALDESELILFIVDATTSVTDIDYAIANRFRGKKTGKVILCANKTESDTAAAIAHEYCALGLGSPFAISAIHGQNVADLLDLIAVRLKHIKPDYKKKRVPTIRVAILGRPNVGKSSLLNKLYGKERVIVDNKPGTTRDAIDIKLEDDGIQYVLIDTAGMRKKANVSEDVEYYSNIRAAASIDRCDVALLIIDATRGVEEQDCRIMNLILDRGKGLLIVLNKWDLIDKDHKTFDRTVVSINDSYPEFKHIPKLSISALTGQRVHTVLKNIRRVFDYNQMRLNKEKFSIFISTVLKKLHPPAKAKRHIRIFSIKQEAVSPPTFVGRTNFPKNINDSYTRFIRNRIIEKYAFEGCSVRVKWKTPKKEKTNA